MSLVPRKRKGRGTSEDAELLKLVGAVLQSSSPKPIKPRITLRHRLRRVRKALRRQTREHPILVSSALVCVASLAFFVGFAATSLAERPGDAPRGAGPGHRGPAGPPTVNTTSPDPVGSGAGPGRVVDADLRRDIGTELIQRVIDGDYAQRSDIATGRFLKDFENQWFLLVDVARTQLQVARRGKGWVQVRGPYSASEDKHRTHLTVASERWKQATEALIRMVEEDDVWKLEHIRVF